MQKSLALLPTEVGVGITEDKPNRRKEVTLSRTIAADDDIVFRREGLDDCLILVTIGIQVSGFIVVRLMVDVHIPLKALDDNLLDIHFEQTRDAMITANNALRGRCGRKKSRKGSQI